MLGNKQVADASDRLDDIPIEQIFIDHDFNSRGKVVPFDVLELAESIKDVGLLEPVLVEPFEKADDPTIKFRLIAGHRRTVACKVAKVPKVKAIIRTGLDDANRRLINLVENLHRKELNIKQEAHGLTDFIDKWAWPDKEIAEFIGQPTRWVEVRRILRTLPDDVQDVAAAGFLTQEQIRQMKGKTLPQIYASIQEIKNSKLRTDSKKIIDKPINEPVDNHVKKVRQRKEIFEMQMRIFDYAGAGLWTRCFAWVCGEISNYELLQSLEEHTKQFKPEKPYTVPQEMKDEYFKKAG